MRATSLGLLLLALAGCPKPSVPPPDGGQQMKPPEIPPEDSGVPPWVRRDDAGYVYLDRFAGEKCPEEAFGGEGADAGNGEYTVAWGICVAMRKMSGQALLNNQPVSGQIEVHFVASQYGAELIRNVDMLGRYEINVMRTRYDVLQYHPDGIWPNHKGFEELGFIDMTKNQDKTLAVKSHTLRGGAFFAGLPFAGVTFPPDVYLRAAGDPPDQHAGSTSVGGTYELGLMDGTMALLLNSPPEALQGTELIDYPLTWSYSHHDDAPFDINIPGNELEGDIRIDGMPLADRKPGYDYELNYTPNGEERITAVTHHEGGVAGFHSLLPKGKYSVTLNFDSIPDKHMPAMLFNKQVAVSADLNANATLSKNFTTVPIEGGITIDGKSPTVNPGYNWVLYMYAFAGAQESWFFAYYKVPLDSGSFALRAFPGTYYVAIQLSDDLAPDLVEGWHRVARQTDIFGPSQLPIVIETSTFTGKVLIDGAPPPVGMEAGEVMFRQSDISFTKKIFTAADGEFRMRVPKGAYEVFFTINRNTYPEHASGRERLIARLEMFDDQVADLVYDTVPVRGPIRVGGDVVADNLTGDDVRVNMRRRQDESYWEWGFPGGKSDFYLRIPQGLYEMEFEILDGAMPNTAHGTAPLGYQLPAFSPYVRTSPAR